MSHEGVRLQSVLIAISDEEQFASQVTGERGVRKRAAAKN